MLFIDIKHLDTDEFLLNTPSTTYDLKKGISMEPSSSHFITKQTSVDPSEEGTDIWQDMLDSTFLEDKELIEYVQRVAGLAAIGKVYIEALIIAYGEGRNGKSTFWNVIARVLGSYSGNISADVLTVGNRRNVKPELAEAKGKRLLIAAELEEGMRLSTSNIKQLCSTDEIFAEKKYKDPFGYVPTHTLVLYTNHLPKVGAIDEGTWRRLIVIPFEAKIEGSSDIKNYGDYLYKEAGGAILKWIIEGAKKVIKDDFKINQPKKVKEAIKSYKENNDWLAHFLEECCEIDESYTAKSGEVYDEYRAFCVRTGGFARSTADFYTALESLKFERFRDRKGRYIKGLKLKSDFMSEA
jgi:P4 family phage/plasmid primase-like protien